MVSYTKGQHTHFDHVTQLMNTNVSCFMVESSTSPEVQSKQGEFFLNNFFSLFVLTLLHSSTSSEIF